ncbi:hypothetical protein H6G80_31190 [Nostoc sp. FACHB-87]|uniref:hypothetical protein n=1 Tax=Nostocaceae TaxID=1162 RepID=UPI0016850B9D|nr:MULTISPECIES: hypothetical protein [Nostocaceae]MBD2458518.1 hypothetical protein [Nostoc sp. FACHB-87]MBD2479598.1 hypothetical protein [Anabaena sp. FACHB-83]
MEPTISIPQDWQYPRFGFGGRTELGVIIGLKYYAEDTYLANEYGAGWRYILLFDKHGEDEEHRTEDEIQLLSPQELKTTLEAEIQNHQRQIESLKHQLDAIPAIVLTANPTVEETTQQPQEPRYPSLHDLVNGAKFLIQEIAKHPDYLTLEYQPDLTIGDADTALSYLELELEPPENSR